jgi:hypothetical protein
MSHLLASTGVWLLPGSSKVQAIRVLASRAVIAARQINLENQQRQQKH